MAYPTFSYAKKGALVRLTYLVVAALYYVLRTITGLRDRGVVVLCYHSVSKAQRASFERQMRHVAGRVRPLDGVTSPSVPSSAVVVTFDDAFECLLDNVLPITRRLAIPISVFAVTGNCGRTPGWAIDRLHPDRGERTMTEEQLRYLSGQPDCLIGSHTVSHRALATLVHDEVEKELTDSRNFLVGLLGTEVDYLALPHGSYTPEVLSLAAKAGYQKVLTLDEIASPENWAAGTIGRFSVSPDMWITEFVLTAHGAYAWLYGWRRWLRAVRASIRRRA